MIHKMKLNNRPFGLMKNGAKTIELRLLDDKRKKIHIGDYIVFSNTDNSNNIIGVEVTGLIMTKNFLRLFDFIDTQKCGFDKNMNNSEAAREMLQYYSQEEIDRLGVLAIVIEAVDLNEASSLEELEFEKIYDSYFPDGMK